MSASARIAYAQWIGLPIEAAKALTSSPHCAATVAKIQLQLASGQAPSPNCDPVLRHCSDWPIRQFAFSDLLL